MSSNSRNCSRPRFPGGESCYTPSSPATIPALRGVSFTVSAGEIVALVGANGAGKSTLLRILTTLLLPTSGHAWVGGADVVRDPFRVRQQLGYSGASDGSFYARLSARENLQLFAMLNNIAGREAAQRIAHVSDLLNLHAFMDKQVRTFSTGTVHRLGLARALLHRPAVLLLDEPTRSLDPLAAAEFRRFLRDEISSRQGTTLLFASHTLAEVEQLAGRVALLHNGQLLAFGTTDALKAQAGALTLEQSIEALVRRAPAA